MKILRTFLHGLFYTEEGEEKHPPVGKDINRPPFPNHSPPHDDAQGLHVILTSFTRGDVILAW